MPEGRVRVLVVTPSLAPELLEAWKAAAASPSIDLHVTGSLVPNPADFYPSPTAVPQWGEAHPLPPADALSARGGLWWRLDGLEALIVRLRPDVVHVLNEVWGRLVSQALRGNAAVVAHGAENLSLTHGNRAEALVRPRVASRNARRLSGYASWNAAGVELIARHGLPRGAPTAVAPSVVPDPEPLLQVEHSRPMTQRVRVGYLGRLVPEKGVQWLIASLDDISSAELVVIGAGPYEGELRQQARRRGLVAHFPGPVAHDALPSALGTLDVLVVPSLTRPGWVEQFGRVVCEAMLAGVPVVASASGALPEVVGRGGVLVRELDHAGLHSVLLGLVADGHKRQALGERGRAWALQHLSPCATAKTMVSFWHDVAEWR